MTQIHSCIKRDVPDWQKCFVERLVMERKKRKMTQEDLAIELCKETATISSWEQFRSIPDFKTMLCLSKMFGCDLDYLTGRINEHTNSIKTACEATGLSEKAIKKIKKTISSTALNHLIESAGFLEFMTAYCSFLDLLSKMKHTSSDYGLVTDYRERADGKVVMSEDEAVHHYMNKALMVFHSLCVFDYKKTIKEKNLQPNPHDYEDLIEQIKATDEEIKYLQDEKKYLKTEILPIFTDEDQPGRKQTRRKRSTRKQDDQ